MRGLSLTPGEIAAPPGHSASYAAFGAQDALSAPYMLPGQFLHGIRPEATQLPEAPLLVFINARSGGRSGPELAQALSRALGRVQVFDLSLYKPDKVLQQLWDNFKTAIAAGLPHAATYQSRLRILVAGGDGTIAWVMGTIKAMKLQPTPPVAIMPLGTGNDLSRTFGWGEEFKYSWIHGYTNIYNTLLRVNAAKVVDLDCWSLRLHFPHQDLMGSLPHSLKAVHTATQPPPPSDAATKLGGGTVAQGPPGRAGGLFWNYVSVGMDARAAQNFHHLREERPGCASNRLMNQFWYSFFSCTSGWFCCPKGVGAKTDLHVQRPGSDEWVQVPLPSGVKALVVLNLQSYAGGRNLWGKPTAGPSVSPSEALGHDTFQEPSCNDGRLEVVGLCHGLHTAAVMGTKGHPVHAMRLCQASGVRLSLRAKHVRPDGQPSHAYLQVDGEPWKQDVPSAKDDEPIVVEIAHQGVSRVLQNQGPGDDWWKGLCGEEPAQRRPGAAYTAESDNSQRAPSALRPAVAAAMASLAGTVVTEQGSEAVQVGSERASSMQSGSSWAQTSTRANNSTV